MSALSSFAMFFAQAVQNQAAAAAPAAEPSGMEGWLKLLIALLVVVGSFGLGTVIARGLRMPDYAFKIGIVLFTVIAGIVICIVGWPPKRGIDLSGGVILVYEVDKDQQQTGGLDQLAQELKTKSNAGQEDKIDVRVASGGRIEVVAPTPAAIARVRDRIVGLADEGTKLIADGERKQGDATVLVYKVDEGTKTTLDMQKLVAAVSRRINPGGVKEVTVRQYGAEQIEVIIPEVEQSEVEFIKRQISTSGSLEFRIVANRLDHGAIIRAAEQSTARDVFINGQLRGRWYQYVDDHSLTGRATTRESKNRGREALMVIDPYNVTGQYLTRATADIDETGSPCVNFNFNSQGAALFGQLTGNNLPIEGRDPRQLAVILDGIVQSAPNIQSRIAESGRITGRFNDEDVKALVGVLNAGALPTALRKDPISEQRTSAQLGADTIRSGAQAMAYSTIAVLIFMGVYYRFAGLVADLAVVINVMLTVAVMILIKAAFTLPGLAGLVLTVGMAVDANVLVYERIREESTRGASLRMAIRNGFSRAMATIVDSNLTTIITGIVLYVIGTDQIKGFAVTLIIGLLISMYTAVFVARILFDIAERRRWISRFKFMQIIGETHIDFVRWRTPAIIATTVMIAIGLGAAAIRGKDIFDIDFTGGSSVNILLKEPVPIADVRTAVTDLAGDGTDVAVSSVGSDDREYKDRQYKIDSGIKDVKLVQSRLQEIFAGKLATYEMKVGPVETISGQPVEPPDARSSGEAVTPDDKPAAKSDEAAKSGAAPPETKADAPAADEAPPEKSDSPEQPNSDSPSTPETGAQSDPTETPPAEQPKPDESSARQSLNRNDRLLASTGSTSEVLALLALGQNEDAATEQATDSPEQPAAETPAADNPSTPADETAAESSAKPESTDTPPSDESSARTGEPERPAATSPPGETANSTSAEEPKANPFAGGSRVTLKFTEKIGYKTLHEMLETQLAEIGAPQGTPFELSNPNYVPGSSNGFEDWTLDVLLPKEDAQRLVGGIQAKITSTPVFPSSNAVGGKVADDTQKMAFVALVASCIMIVIYVWVRFQNLAFGLAAVLALVHDVLMTVGFLALSYYMAPYLGFLLIDPFKISLPVVAALLTIIGFSINDTIVIFDRIREIKGKSPEVTGQMINDAVNQTLSRTILTSGTVFIATIILYIIGGQPIHAFAFAMLVGVIAGTYSSVYIAAPVLLWMRKNRPPAYRRASETAGTAVRT